MSLARWKIVYWAALAASLGGISLFALLVAEKGPPTGREVWIWLWPILSVPVALFALRRLMQSYKIEPLSGPELWQLQILDLIGATLGAGLGLTLWQSLWPESLVPHGLCMVLVSLVFLVIGLLAGRRIGLTQPFGRLLYAAGLMLSIYGFLALGATVTMLIVAGMYGESPFRMIKEIAKAQERWEFGLLFALWCLPPGMALCFLSRKGLPREISTPDPALPASYSPAQSED
ncbi:MAG: hypothetical protein HS116_24115 [Planctomycetes bacterium]|nr:hypothetical protein [Planctomycetota bacterium]